MSERTPLRLLALPVGAVALLLAGAACGVPGDASRAGSSRVALPTNGGPTPSRETTGPSPTLQPKPSRVDTTRPASTETAPPDPHIGQSPLVESSASEATPFECALDGAAFAECSSPAPRAGALNTFAQTEDRTLAVDDVTVTEGDAGTITAGFSVTLSAASKSTVTVNYATAGVSATPDTDFQSTTGTLTFDPDVTSQPINVTVNGDVVDEADETFTVTLSAPRGATLLDDVGTGTITDDDPEPTLSASDITVAEGDAGTTEATFDVTLSAASGQQVTVDFATENDTASGADYTAAADTLTFVPGDVTETVTISVTGDLLDEADETFTVGLSGAVNATIAGDQATGTITDDDDMPSLSINDVSVVEGHAGTAPANFVVILSAPSGRTVTARFATANGTALSGSDYVARIGTVTFAPGETSQQVSVSVRGDTLAEASETYFLNLSAEANATIADTQGVGTIIDDDGDPVLRVDDVTVIEGNSGTVNATFTVTLAAASGQTVFVHYESADGTAVAGADYTAISGDLAFAPNQTTKTVGVSVKGDSVIEADETFVVNLLNVVAGSISDGQGVGTIANDDAAPPPPLPPGPPPPPPPAPDTTSPGEVRNVRVKAGDETATISWTNPSDSDFQGVSVRRISAGKSIQNLAVYEGVGTTFTQRGLKNGSRYRYRIKTRDRAGNTSAGIVVIALPKSALLGPAEGAIVTAPPLLRWAPYPRAKYYNAQLYMIRGGSQTKAQVTTKVLSIWPNGTRYKLSKTWRYRGKRYRLVPGRYRWYVWPGLGKRSANSYGPMLGESTFTVKAKRTR